jgi:hypothetical protein
MLQAQLCGKLTIKEQRMEDLLTSNVLGSLKYVPYIEGLYLIFQNSYDQNSRRAPIPQNITKVAYKFWPRMKEKYCKECEPDVLLTMVNESKKIIEVLIEAKFLSDKSSEATEEVECNDQLAREWENLTKRTSSNGSEPILLYITNDLYYPSDSIKESIEEFNDKWDRTDQAQNWKKPMHVYWISWRELPRILGASRHEILLDLVELLRNQGLTFFEGIKLSGFTPSSWEFTPSIEWTWYTKIKKDAWIFKTGKA